MAEKIVVEFQPAPLQGIEVVDIKPFRLDIDPFGHFEDELLKISLYGGIGYFQLVALAERLDHIAVDVGNLIDGAVQQYPGGMVGDGPDLAGAQAPDDSATAQPQPIGNALRGTAEGQVGLQDLGGNLDQEILDQYAAVYVQAEGELVLGDVVEEFGHFSVHKGIYLFVHLGFLEQFFQGLFLLFGAELAFQGFGLHLFDKGKQGTARFVEGQVEVPDGIGGCPLLDMGQQAAFVAAHDKRRGDKQAFGCFGEIIDDFE